MDGWEKVRGEESWGEVGERRGREKEREIFEPVSLAARKRKREETDA